MGLKRIVSDEETSPVKLRKDAEAAISVLSPFSSPGQFKRKLSKYSMVVSPNVIGYASDVIVSMADKPTKSAYKALEQTLNTIKTLLDCGESSRSSTTSSRSASRSPTSSMRPTGRSWSRPRRRKGARAGSC